MCRLLETIKVENGQFNNIGYHNKRMNEARSAIFGEQKKLRLEKEIRLPPQVTTGLYRCRVIYRKTIENVEFLTVCPRLFNSLKIVRDPQISYPFKFEDRSSLDRLSCQKGSADEIIIIKNHLVTDCSIGNMVFYDGTTWFTPDSPLLKGTQRQFLLDHQLIRERKISEKDIFSYKKAGLINAFFGMKNMPVIKIENIFVE